MDWWTAAILGIIQGITEWLPISSSGQTSIVMVGGFGIEPEMAITLGLAIHIGTALAVVAKYPKDIMKMTNPKAGKIQEFYWIVTIISLLCAIPFLILLEATFDSNLWTGETITIFVGLALIITGLILKAGKTKKGDKLAKA
ncbi:MAG: undecaprenyl-diphosphate phosphatase, partial [Thermoplasmata archaeon]|nr:undecaprenyl-diphosphate phosphatase [Thermoplasmata archaeon]